MHPNHKGAQGSTGQQREGQWHELGMALLVMSHQAPATSQVTPRGPEEGPNTANLKVCHGFAAVGEYPSPSLTLLLKF